MINYREMNQVGESEEFYSFQNILRKAASVDRPVLLIGERGSGKEVAASRLHYLSSRWKSSFVTLNCAALPPSLIETELFGHEAGAFTGASAKRKGRFEEADKGTLFLDEIALIPLEVQEKILRVVEYGTFERVGSSETIETDVRIIGAANRDLRTLCMEGKFKQDLLDRLTFEVLFVPPLRARRGDIMVLSDFFAQKMGRELGKLGNISFSEETENILNSYRWPGNIRELKNTVERAVYKAEGATVNEIILDPFINPYDDNTVLDRSEEDKFAEFDPSDVLNGKKLSKELFSEKIEAVNFHKEFRLPLDFCDYINKVRKELISSALVVSENNQKSAARLLNLSYDQFRGLYRKYK
jgi:psp operon transcriptional activator